MWPLAQLPFHSESPYVQLLGWPTANQQAGLAASPSVPSGVDHGAFQQWGDGLLRVNGDEELKRTEHTIKDFPTFCIYVPESFHSTDGTLFIFIHTLFIIEHPYLYLMIQIGMFTNN